MKHLLKYLFVLFLPSSSWGLHLTLDEVRLLFQPKITKGYAITPKHGQGKTYFLVDKKKDQDFSFDNDQEAYQPMKLAQGFKASANAESGIFRVYTFYSSPQRCDYEKMGGFYCLGFTLTLSEEKM